MTSLFKFILLVVNLFLLANTSSAQVAYSDALMLANSRAKKIGYTVEYSKIGNLNGTGKKLYWFMAVGYDGGACIMSIPETALKVDYSKCVKVYEVDDLSNSFSEIPEFVDPDELRRRQELEEAERLKALEMARKERERMSNYKFSLRLGDTLFEARNYFGAREMYQKALSFYENDEVAKQKYNRAKDLLDFLDQRKVTWYDLRDINSATYSKLNERIEKQIKEIFINYNSNTEIGIDIMFVVDTLGIRRDSVGVFGCDVLMKDSIRNIIRKVELDIQLLNGFSVNFISKLTYNLNIKEYSFSALKNNISTRLLKNPNALESYLAVKWIPEYAPIGKYSVTLHQRSINNFDFSHAKISSFSAIGGSSNAILSVLVPGLGVKPVTGGVESGFKRTIASYSLLTSAFLLKSYSKIQYQKYLDEKDPLLYDKYYKRANSANKLQKGLLFSALAYWLYDIQWVYRKGRENDKYRKSYFEDHKIALESGIGYLAFNYFYSF